MISSAGIALSASRSYAAAASFDFLLTSVKTAATSPWVRFGQASNKNSNCSRVDFHLSPSRRASIFSGATFDFRTFLTVSRSPFSMALRFLSISPDSFVRNSSSAFEARRSV